MAPQFTLLLPSDHTFCGLPLGHGDVRGEDGTSAGLDAWSDVENELLRAERLNLM